MCKFYDHLLCHFGGRYKKWRHSSIKTCTHQVFLWCRITRYLSRPPGKLRPHPWIQVAWAALVWSQGTRLSRQHRRDSSSVFPTHFSNMVAVFRIMTLSWRSLPSVTRWRGPLRADKKKKINPGCINFLQTAALDGICGIKIYIN